MKKNRSMSQDRLDVLARIDEYEKLGGEYFFKDVENDPPSHPLMPDEVDYLCQKTKNRFHRIIARILEGVATIVIKRKYRIRIEGTENIRDIESGAVLTSNHFSVTENIAVKAAAKKTRKKHRFCKIIREGNYFMPGLIGYLLKHCDTLPLSSHLETMGLLNHAVEKVLADGAFLLVYPEQAMWWNYKRPRPYRIGAYYYAAKAGVPVIPCFTTLKEKGRVGKNGFPMYSYTVHVMPAIYPDAKKSVRANAAEMQKKNADVCRDMYESVYGIPLVYQS